MTERWSRYPGWKRGIILASCLGCLLLVKTFQDRIDASLDHERIDPDLLYFASPAAVKALAFGYDGLVADLYWMRSIQYYGRRDNADLRPVRYKNLAAMLDIVTTLDPLMTDVYRAGSCFLSEPEPIGAGDPQAAVRLLDKGMAHLPQEWGLWFDKGFVYFWHLKDCRRAAQTWMDALAIPGAPRWLEALAAESLSKGGEVETAKNIWRRQVQQATRADVKDNAWNHLASFQVMEDIWTLEFFLEKYRSKYGRYPATLDRLAKEKIMTSVPDDPSGTPYMYGPVNGTVSLSPDSGVHFIRMPYDYREDFLKGLESWYEGRQKGIR